MAYMPEAVTIDFHNTIAKCDEWFHLEVYQLAPEFLRWHARQDGAEAVPVSPRQAQAVYRRIRRDVMLHGLEKDAITCIDLVTRELGYPLDREHIDSGIEELMRATLDDCSPVEGVIDGVRQLRSMGVRLAIISSAVYHPFVEWALEKFDIQDDFDAVITSASSGYYKSRTEIYRLAIEALRTKPEHAVHVGDSLTYDVETAARIGMGTLLYDPEHNAELTNGTSAVVSSLQDLACVVERVYMEKHR